MSSIYRELTSTFGRLCRLVDDVVKEMNVEINGLDHEIEQLAESASNAAELKGRADALIDTLDRFSERYLSRS